MTDPVYGPVTITDGGCGFPVGNWVGEASFSVTGQPTCDGTSGTVILKTTFLMGCSGTVWRLRIYLPCCPIGGAGDIRRPTGGSPVGCSTPVYSVYDQFDVNALPETYSCDPFHAEFPLVFFGAAWAAYYPVGTNLFIVTE